MNKRDNIKEIIYNYYGHNYDINYLLGANLKNSNIKYNDIQFLFLNSKTYKTHRLFQTELYKNIDTISDIDLSNNDFSNFTWNFTDFFGSLLDSVTEYVNAFYSKQFNEINKLENLDYTSTYVDDSYIDKLQKRINDDIAKVILKLIPNVSNTNLKIKFEPSISSNEVFIDEIITELLKSGKFEGCYLNFYYKYTYKSWDKKVIKGYMAEENHSLDSKTPKKIILEKAPQDGYEITDEEMKQFQDLSAKENNLFAELYLNRDDYDRIYKNMIENVLNTSNDDMSNSKSNELIGDLKNIRKSLIELSEKNSQAANQLALEILMRTGAIKSIDNKEKGYNKKR